MTRWKVDELATRYLLEPTLKDYYVEGGSDLYIYRSYLEGAAREDVVLYDIDGVDISDDDLTSIGLTPGQRQRVIYLMRVLEEVTSGSQCFGIVDRDLEDEFPTPLNTSKVIMTKYRDLESYFMTEDYLGQILVRSCRANVENWSEFFASFVRILYQLHAIRLADRELNIGAGRIRLKKYVSSEAEKLTFRQGDYVRSLLTSMGVGKRIPEMSAATDRWCRSFTGDARNNIRGHDFVELLLASMKCLSAKGGWNSESAIYGAFALVAFHHPNVLEGIF